MQGEVHLARHDAICEDRYRAWVGAPLPCNVLHGPLAPIFHDLEVKPPPSCANVALGLHRKGAGPVGSDDASAQLRGMIHTCRLRS